MADLKPDHATEIGLYGGTFTALPEQWMERFLTAARSGRERGVVCAVRCSTRPDAVSGPLLRRLAAQGLDRVELGVQTFHDPALVACQRGHDAHAARRGCEAVAEAGLALCLHLLPGLPGQDVAAFEADVEQVARLRPEAVRLHPCLALAGTGLEPLWRAGGWQPWSDDEAVERLAPAVLRLWRAGVRVSRIGLASEPSLEAAVLAGARHPALGSRVRALALLLHIAHKLAGRKALGLRAPQSASGGFWGHKRELLLRFETLGLTPGNVMFENRTDFELETDHA